MGDCTSYASIRGPYNRDYEKFPYGSLENASRSPVKSAYCIAQGKFISDTNKTHQPHFFSCSIATKATTTRQTHYLRCYSV